MHSDWNHNLEDKKKRQCPSCHTDTYVFFENSRIISCHNCNTVFNSETSRKERAILGKNPQKKPTNPTFLEVGQEFIQKSTYRKGDRFKINAYVYVKSNFETFGAEKKYIGKWYYHEWLCTSQSGAFISIVYDKEGYKIVTPAKVEKKLNPETSNSLYFNNQKYRSKIEERSTNEVLFFEGESQDAYFPGYTFKSAFSSAKGYGHGLDWEDPNLVETHAYYEQRPIGEKMLFDKIDTANDISVYKKKIADYHFFRKAMLYTSVALFVLWFISLFYSGSNVYKQEFDLAKILDEEVIKGKESVKIKDLSSVYQLDLSVEMEKSNTEVYAAVEILNENENVINVIQSDFWKASGIDGGEKWSEESVGLVNYYSFPKQGSFSLVFHADKTNLTFLSPNDKLKFEINRGALLSRYFILLFLFFLVFTIVLYAQGTNSKIRLLFLK